MRKRNKVQRVHKIFYFHTLFIPLLEKHSIFSFCCCILFFVNMWISRHKQKELQIKKLVYYLSLSLTDKKKQQSFVLSFLKVVFLRFHFWNDNFMSLKQLLRKISHGIPWWRSVWMWFIALHFSFSLSLAHIFTFIIYQTRLTVSSM